MCIITVGIGLQALCAHVPLTCVGALLTSRNRIEYPESGTALAERERVGQGAVTRQIPPGHGGKTAPTEGAMDRVVSSGARAVTLAPLAVVLLLLLLLLLPLLLLLLLLLFLLMLLLLLLLP